MVPVRRHARDWLAYLAGGGLVLIGILLASGEGNPKTAPQQNEAAKYAKKGTAPARRYKYHEHATEDEHRTAEQINWRRSNVLTGIAILFTGAAAFFAYKTYLETRQQAIDGHQNLIASERPYLEIVDGIEAPNDAPNSITLKNIGNTTATNITISAELRFLELIQPAIDLTTIKCNVKRGAYTTVNEQPKVILQKGIQNFIVYIDTGNRSLKYFLPRNQFPFAVGCIQYGWPAFGNDSFHVFFMVRAIIVDSRNGETLHAPIMSPEVPDQFMSLRFDNQTVVYLGID